MRLVCFHPDGEDRLVQTSLGHGSAQEAGWSRGCTRGQIMQKGLSRQRRIVIINRQRSRADGRPVNSSGSRGRNGKSEGGEVRVRPDLNIKHPKCWSYRKINW